MSHSQRIRANDLAALLRLVHELHDLGSAGVIERHQHMLGALRRLLQARYAVSSVVRVGPGASGDARLMMFIYHGWDDDFPQRRQAANDYLRTLEPTSPARPRLLRLLRTSIRFGEGDTPVTRTRQQLVDDRTWYASAYVQQVHRPMGADHALFSLLSMNDSPAGEQLATGLWVLREWGERRSFDPRDSMLLRAFHSSTQWMFAFNSPEQSQSPDSVGRPKPVNVTLSPRQKQTLRLLLSGDSEKQIATKLLRSRHTVHEHVKAIYRAIGVNSRAELFARFLRR